MPDRLNGFPAILPYRRSWLRTDALAGLTTGAAVIPQAMAYATVAGMPVQIGLYTCMVPLVVYAFLGGSRYASVTTTSTIATLSGSTVLATGVVAGSPDAQAQLVTLTMLVGAFLLAARLLRLGAIIENVNQATLLGIKVGVGLTVAASQLPKLLGVSPGPDDEGFFHLIAFALREIRHANPVTLAVSVAAIAALVAMARFLPRIPGPLVVVGVGIALVASGGLSGLELIPQVVPGLPTPAPPSLAHIPALVPGALAIALMAFLETLAVARGVRRPEEPPIDADRELAATGLSALFGGVFHALPPAGGFSQTSLNMRAGARSQVSGLVTAAMAVMVALFLAPVLGNLPQAILGALVLVAVMGLIDIAALTQLYRFDRHEFVLATLVAAMAVIFGLLSAVATGVLLTLYSVLREVNRAHIVQLVERDGSWVEGPEGVLVESADPLVVRSRLGLYTANLRANTAMIVDLLAQCSPPARCLVWDLSTQPAVTTTVLDGLRDAETELKDVRVLYTALPDGPHRTAQRWPWWQQVERDGRYFRSVEQAVTST